MSAKLIDGKSISADIRNELKHKINDIRLLFSGDQRLYS